jgi:hypothetical protein
MQRQRAKAKAVAKKVCELPLWKKAQADWSPNRNNTPFKTETKLEFMTWRALKANVKIAGMSPEQIGVLVNGDAKELYQEMLEDRMATERSDESAPKYGATHYEHIKDEFGPSGAPANKLRVQDEKQTIDEELISGLTEIQSFPKSYDRAWLCFE